MLNTLNFVDDVSRYPKEECLIIEKFYWDFFKNKKYLFLKDKTFLSVLDHWIKEKINIGERIFVTAENERDFFQQHIQSLAVKMTITFSLNPIYTTKKITNRNISEEILNFSGITVVPDVHGNIESLKSAVDWAKKRNNFLIFLGDIIDYGDNSIECIELVYDLLIENKCAFVIGNHEFKFKNYFQGKSVKLSEGNNKTLSQIQKMEKNKQDIIKRKLLSLFYLGSYHYTIDHVSFCHGGFDERILSISDNHLFGILSKKIMFGYEQHKHYDDDHPKDYSWVNDVPPHIRVVVGHDIRHNFIPKIDDNVLFLDTGCNKGGVLTTLDIEIPSMKFMNFNRFQH